MNAATWYCKMTQEAGKFGSNSGVPSGTKPPPPACHLPVPHLHTSPENETKAMASA
jgi:hypothetical protein